jgi:hypothetical protein
MDNDSILSYVLKFLENNVDIKDIFTFFFCFYRSKLEDLQEKDILELFNNVEKINQDDISEYSNLAK